MLVRNKVIGRLLAGLLAAVVGAGIVGVPASGLTPVSGSAVVPAVTTSNSSGDSGERIYVPGDLSGDGFADLLSTDAEGRLWLRTGTGLGGLADRAVQIGHGWTGRTVIPAGDLNGDGRPDILSTDSAGLLWFYPGRGAGRLGAAVQVGQGWTSGDRIFPAGDLNGDSRIDLLAIDAQGLLWFYRGRGDGTFGKKVQVGQGWAASDQLYLGGDLGHSPAHDLLAVRAGGQLWVYPGRGDGTFHASSWVGGGWPGLQVAVGDLNRDGIGDIVSLDAGGVLRTHLGKGGGMFRAAKDSVTGFGAIVGNGNNTVVGVWTSKTVPAPDANGIIPGSTLVQDHGTYSVWDYQGCWYKPGRPGDSGGHWCTPEYRAAELAKMNQMRRDAGLIAVEIDPYEVKDWQWWGKVSGSSAQSLYESPAHNELFMAECAVLYNPRSENGYPLVVSITYSSAACPSE